jgi:HNH endonuclease
MLTHERLLHLIDYDPQTGVFCWKNCYFKSWRGKKAGSINGEGYVHIKIDQRNYQAHRLAWFFVRGEWPRQEIDHVNALKADNRFSNLRESTHGENQQNVTRAQRNNRSGYLGVAISNGGFVATIYADGRRHHLGRFNSAEDAHDTYLRAKAKMHRCRTAIE